MLVVDFTPVPDACTEPDDKNEQEVAADEELSAHSEDDDSGDSSFDEVADECME